MMTTAPMLLTIQELTIVMMILKIVDCDHADEVSYDVDYRDDDHGEDNDNDDDVDNTNDYCYSSYDGTQDCGIRP